MHHRTPGLPLAATVFATQTVMASARAVLLGARPASGSQRSLRSGRRGRGDADRPSFDARLESRQSTTNILLGMADSNSTAPDPGPQGRCVCGEKVTIADAHEVTLPNGRAGWQGYCPECGAPLFAIRRGSRASS
jgi:hypothetical protein